MTRVGGIGGPAQPPRRPGRAGGGFALPQDHAETRAAGATAAASAVLFSLQEAPPSPHQAEERARRRARAALDGLRELQLELLRGTTDPERLARLVALAEEADDTGSPALGGLMAEVALRLRVELARRRVAGATLR